MQRAILALFFLLPLAAQDARSVRYIVELEGEPAINASDRRVRREEIREEQSGVRRLLRARSRTVIASTATVANTLIVEGQPGEEALLAAMPGVKRVEPVKELKLFVSRSAGIHKAQAAWTAAGGQNKAGQGIKIGILDTGIEPKHAAFTDADLPNADGFPQGSSDANRSLATNKIIVMRSYDGGTAQDQNGHGTAVAMAAAGVDHDTPYGRLSGMAPKSWLGVYKVNRAGGDGIPTDFALQGLNDAIDDNMDIINLSFGAIGTVGASSDILAEAAQRAAWRGVIVVMAAGNDGPDPMTVDDTAALQDVIAVGASQSDLVFADPAVLLADGTGYPAGITTNSYNTEPQTAELADVESLESTAPEGQKGLGCTKLAEGSLNGKVALIRRGECFFYEKLRNARDAGAISGIIYNRPDADANELIDMDVSDGPSIPGVFIRNADGVALRTALLEKKTLTVTVQYLLAVGDPNSLAEFSSIGPSVDLLIKPDVIAVGAPLLTATQTSFSSGNLSDPSGYIRLNGTSFSAPLVAGAAAVVRAARPGLLAEDYRSLLVNSAAPLKNAEGNDLPVQSTGAGLLDMGRAIGSTIAAFPVSLAFGATTSTIDAWKQFTVRNLGTEAATYELSVESTNDLKPTLSESRVTLSPGDRAWILAVFNNAGVAAGTYQGFIRVKQEGKETDARIPYWLAVRSDEPAQVAFVEQPFSGAPGSTVRVLFRVFDASALPMTTPEPKISVVSGAGDVVSLSPSTSLPNVWVGRVKLGASDRVNGFKIEAGTISRNFEVLGAL